MKLYYSPGACSLSQHIALEEIGAEYEAIRVDLKEHKTESGEDFMAINPKGYVPALVLDDGDMLTENSAIGTYIGDQKPETGLTPACSSMNRYHVDEWLSYIGTELHKNFGPLMGNPPEEARQKALEKLNKRLAFVETSLEGKSYLMGDTFTIADCYAFAVIRWSGWLNVALTPNIAEYMDRIASRPAVQRALTAEGLTYPG